MTLLILGFAPFLVIVGAARAMFYRRHLTKNKEAFSQAGKVREGKSNKEEYLLFIFTTQLVVDSLENVRTVTALNLQNKFASLYEVEIKKPYKYDNNYHRYPFIFPPSFFFSL